MARRLHTLLPSLVAVAATALLVMTLTGPALAGEDPAWVAETEARARTLVREANGERQAYTAGGSVGPRTYEAKFLEAAGLLDRIVAANPTPKRLYGLAFTRFHANQPELAHRACDRLAVEFASETEIIGRCEALTAVLHDTVFRVLVQSEPAGARVLVDGWPATQALTAPGVVWLRAGTRELTFELEGHLPSSQTVKVEAGFVTQVRAQLEKIPTVATFVLHVKPRDAQVFIDRNPVTLDEDDSIQLPVGRHRVTAKLDGYVTRSAEIELLPGERIERSMTLKPRESDPGPEVLPWEQQVEPPEPETPSRPLTTWGWVLVGVGSASIATGGVMHGLAFVDADDAESVPNLPGNRGAFEDKRDSAQMKELTAWTLYGAGAALLTGGILMVVLDEEPAEPEASSATFVAPAAWEGGGGISFTGRF